MCVYLNLHRRYLKERRVFEDAVTQQCADFNALCVRTLERVIAGMRAVCDASRNAQKLRGVLPYYDELFAMSESDAAKFVAKIGGGNGTSSATDSDDAESAGSSAATHNHTQSPASPTSSSTPKPSSPAWSAPAMPPVPKRLAPPRAPSNKNSLQPASSAAKPRAPRTPPPNRAWTNSPRPELPREWTLNCSTASSNQQPNVRDDHLLPRPIFRNITHLRSILESKAKFMLVKGFDSWFGGAASAAGLRLAASLETVKAHGDKVMFWRRQVLAKRMQAIIERALDATTATSRVLSAAVFKQLWRRESTPPIEPVVVSDAAAAAAADWTKALDEHSGDFSSLLSVSRRVERSYFAVHTGPSQAEAYVVQLRQHLMRTGETLAATRAQASSIIAQQIKTLQTELNAQQERHTDELRKADLARAEQERSLREVHTQEAEAAAEQAAAQLKAAEHKASAAARVQEVTLQQQLKQQELQASDEAAEAARTIAMLRAQSSVKLQVSKGLFNVVRHLRAWLLSVPSRPSLKLRFSFQDLDEAVERALLETRHEVALRQQAALRAEKLQGELELAQAAAESAENAAEADARAHGVELRHVRQRIARTEAEVQELTAWKSRESEEVEATRASHAQTVLEFEAQLDQAARQAAQKLSLAMDEHQKLQKQIESTRAGREEHEEALRLWDAERAKLQTHSSEVEQKLVATRTELERENSSVSELEIMLREEQAVVSNLETAVKLVEANAEAAAQEAARDHDNLVDDLRTEHVNRERSLADRYASELRDLVHANEKRRAVDAAAVSALKTEYASELKVEVAGERARLVAQHRQEVGKLSQAHQAAMLQLASTHSDALARAEESLVQLHAQMAEQGSAMRQEDAKKSIAAQEELRKRLKIAENELQASLNAHRVQAGETNDALVSIAQFQAEKLHAEAEIVSMNERLARRDEAVANFEATTTVGFAPCPFIAFSVQGTVAFSYFHRIKHFTYISV